MTTVKIIISTIILVLLAIFCGSNTSNACKISFLWFSTKNEIPVFVSMLLSFVAGVIVMIPVMLLNGHSIKKRAAGKSDTAVDYLSTAEKEADNNESENINPESSENGESGE